VFSGTKEPRGHFCPTRELNNCGLTPFWSSISSSSYPRKMKLSRIEFDPTPTHSNNRKSSQLHDAKRQCEKRHCPHHWLIPQIFPSLTHFVSSGLSAQKSAPSERSLMCSPQMIISTGSEIPFQFHLANNLRITVINSGPHQADRHLRWLQVFLTTRLEINLSRQVWVTLRKIAGKQWSCRRPLMS